MLLHKDGLIELNYDVATDILTAKWPDMMNFTTAEIRFAFKKIVDTLKHYDIKKLLVDSRSNVVEITDEAYTVLALEFTRDLKTSRVKKVARLQTLDPAREKRAAHVTQQVQAQLQSGEQRYGSFPTVQSALEWLRES